MAEARGKGSAQKTEIRKQSKDVSTTARRRRRALENSQSTSISPANEEAERGRNKECVL